jgi:hypothetical protein
MLRQYQPTHTLYRYVILCRTTLCLCVFIPLRHFTPVYYCYCATCATRVGLLPSSVDVVITIKCDKVCSVTPCPSDLTPGR